MDSGALVPDKLIVEMMAGAISKAPAAGFVLDGFPRTVNQAVELDKSLLAREGEDQRIDAVLSLEIDDRVVVERMTGRRSCPKCGAVYHIENLKPKVEGRCDRDGAELVQRPDDSLEVVQNRLKTYHQQTKAVINYYKNSPAGSAFYHIDANREADKVSDSIFESLDALVSA
jgi:adenylate kinase